jgi:hypothetical protein
MFLPMTYRVLEVYYLLRETHAGRRHKCSGVLSGAQRGSVATLPFGTVPHTFPSVDQSPIFQPKGYYPFP